MKQTILRLLILFAGLVVAHLGVSLFLLADLGSDPFNVMIQGLSRMMDIGFMTHSNTHMTISILIIIILLFVDKSCIKIGTLICMFCGGPIIDLFSLLLGNLITPESHMALRIVCNALGCVILACGMSVVIMSKAGTGPNDLVGVVISDKLHKKYSIVRMCVMAAFCSLAGYLEERLASAQSSVSSSSDLLQGSSCLVVRRW